MSFVGVTFDGQNVSPKDDGALYQAHYGDGIIDGCGMTIGSNNDSLVIQSGHIIAGGRQCKVDGATELDLSAVTENYVQVYLQYDVSQAEGEQWDWGYKEQASLPFGALTQEDINGTGNIYQVELAILETSGGNITAINSSMGGSSLIADSPITDGVPTIVFKNADDDQLGLIYSSPTATNMRIANTRGGQTNSGLDLYDNGTPILFAETNNIIFRPKGRNNQSDQVVIDSSGQVRGGHKFIITEDSTSASCTAGYTGIKTELLSAGVWAIEGEVCVRPQQAGVWSTHIGANGSNTDFITGRQALYCSNTSDYWNMNVFALVQATQGQAFSLICYGQYAYTRAYWKFALTQIS